MKVKFLFPTLAILFPMMTFFAVDAVADTESASGLTEFLIILIVIILLVVGWVCLWRLSTRKQRPFLKEHRDQLSSDDPKVLIELAEKCDDYLKNRYSDKISRLERQAWAKIESTFLKEHHDQLSSEDPQVLLELSEKCDEFLKDRHSVEVERLAQQAKTKGTRIQTEIDFQASLATFKSEISEDGSHPAVVAKIKETMHNPDSLQHVSSDYETVEQDGKRYHKIEMTFRATNTFNALVLQTCYFLVDMDNQVSLVGSPDSTESSPVNTVSLAAAADVAVDVVDGIATLADLLLLFSSDEE